MFEGIFIFASHTILGGGLIGNTLAQWEQAGFFSFILPFLLIFAMVFGILTRTRIFPDNKAVNGIIALSIALLSLQFDIVPRFFSEVFPRLGVGLAIILIALILVGMFLPNKQVGLMMLVGVVVFVVILVQTAGALQWTSAFWWFDNWLGIVIAVVLISFVVAIINSGAPSKDEANDSILGQALLGDLAKRK